MSTVRHSFRSVILALFVITAPSAWASAVSDLLNVSGFTEQIDLMPAQMKQGMQQGLAPLPLPPETVAGVLSSVDRYVVSEEIVSGIESHLESVLSAQEIETLLAWYRSDVGMRITAAENAAADPEAAATMAAMFESLVADTERMAEAQEINTLVRGTEFALDIASTSQLAMMSGMLGNVNEEDRNRAIAEMNSAFEAMRPEMDRNMSAYLAFTYRNLDAADLDRYKTFLGTDVSQKFNREVLAAMLGQWETAFSGIGVALAEAMAQIVPVPPQ